MERPEDRGMLLVTLDEEDDVVTHGTAVNAPTPLWWYDNDNDSTPIHRRSVVVVVVEKIMRNTVKVL